ncbi:tetratricopeptide repeat protein [Lactobacillus porci]|uniref:tetratricopeptide repeat protein n=1 Tax=Lactobacillus porci TaxID=2012477 RepID=UPI003996953A
MYGNFKLTAADREALDAGDGGFLNDHGAACYRAGDYARAVEYYRLAAALGEATAISNLGYCFLYGRSIARNRDLAIAYFKIAARKGNVNAMYKLGDIYSSSKWGVEDRQRSIEYYEQAVEQLLGPAWAFAADLHLAVKRLLPHPSLCYALGREYLTRDLDLACQFLLLAHVGYQIFIEGGEDYYCKADREVEDLLGQSCFADRRKKWAQVLF